MTEKSGSQDDLPLCEADGFGPTDITSLARMWIVTLGQFLGRTATEETRRRVAEELQVPPARIDEWRAACLRRLPTADRDRFSAPPPALSPRPGMGLRLKPQRPEEKE